VDKKCRADEVSAEMSSVLTKRTLASVLRSPALAVVAAYGLRMVLLWLAHHNEDPVNPRFETIGLENNLVAMSLAMSKGFFGPYPGYEAVTAVLAPVSLDVGNRLQTLPSRLFWRDAFLRDDE
jgi:hypothetical protein